MRDRDEDIIEKRRARRCVRLERSLRVLLACWATAGAADLAASGSVDVVRIEVEGKPGAYFFTVTLSSPDTGCARYADWWEVVSEDGRLLYRRVLAHSPTSRSKPSPAARRAGASRAGHRGLGARAFPPRRLRRAGDARVG
jgi:hypothetical protein